MFMWSRQLILCVRVINYVEYTVSHLALIWLGSAMCKARLVLVQALFVFYVA